MKFKGFSIETSKSQIAFTCQIRSLHDLFPRRARTSASPQTAANFHFCAQNPLTFPSCCSFCYTSANDHHSREPHTSGSNLTTYKLTQHYIIRPSMGFRTLSASGQFSGAHGDVLLSAFTGLAATLRLEAESVVWLLALSPP